MCAGINRSVNHREPFGHAELGRLLSPRSVAVIGASETPDSFGANTLLNLKDARNIDIYPINPKYDRVFNQQCYPSIAETPDVPDCAVVILPGEQVLPVVEACADRGVGGAVVYSSGFAELGTQEAVGRQQRLTDIALESGMRVCGPNCIGMANLKRKLGLTFMPSFRDMPKIAGPIGLISQSGGMGYVVLQAMQRGVGFSYYLATGNACDVDASDFINYLAEDSDTRAIACILEGVNDSDRLLQAGRRALAGGKPMVVLKLGRSALGQRAALSHTGTLAGSAAAYNAAFSHIGAVVVEDFDALLETAAFLAGAGEPTTHGIALVSASGGASILATDLAEDLGLSLPPPEQKTAIRIQAAIPPFGKSGNPADITAESVRNKEMYGDTIRALADDPSYGAVVVAMPSAHGAASVERAEYLCELGRQMDKPLCIVWLNEWYQGPGSETFDRSLDLHIFRTLRRCFTAIKQWHRYHERRRLLLRDLPSRLSSPPNEEIDERLAESGPTLTESQSKQILAAYGVPVTREALVTDVEDAAVAARQIGFPVALKAASPDILHKAAVDVVRLNLVDEGAVRHAWVEILAAVDHLPKSIVMEGVLVQEMIEAGIEFMVGTCRDAQFGTLVVCGLGGTLVEARRDVAVALAPVSLDEAREMIRSLRGYGVLTRFRGGRAANIDVYADAICRISELAVDYREEIAEIDVNPLILGADGGVAVDALIVKS